MLTKEERILKVIHKDYTNLDYLPSQITFSDRTRMKKLSKTMGFSLVEELDDYLQNHFYMTYTADDIPVYFRNNVELLEKYEKKGYCGVDLENNIFYDSWGIGTGMFTPGYRYLFSPLMEGGNEERAKFMPPHFNRDVLFAKSDEEAIRKYRAPDPDKEDNFALMEKDLKEHSGEYLVLPLGYIGIYERAYELLSFEKFMLLLASKPHLLGELLDKITDYKVGVAKKIVKMGYKVAHSGDDLGSQSGPLFSREMFRKVLRPRMERLWKVWKDAGIPIIFHSCGNITEFIPDLIDMGLDVLEPVQPVMDLEFLKKEYGKDLVFWGGIDTQNLPFLSPEETKKMAAKTIRTLGKGGSYIIAPAQEIMIDVPIENVRTLVETINSEREKVLHI